MPKKKTEEVEEKIEAAAEETAVAEAPTVEAAAEEVTAEASAEAAAEPKEAAAKKSADKKPVEAKAEAKADDPAASKIVHKRAEKIGVVASDKMTNTVTVRVDRLVKHPIYRKYVRKRKKFMAHDELGAKIGDKVRIIETRPLSARKRWRVVEIIQKAEL
ncbi:MAG: 30S ribosomal protein S17 [Acidobacteria bacterium]|nr:30S ribosomal protein S17 [Acidobacteriota bacterium]